ncbi:hypothetical protein IQ64_28355 [Streptomyces stelliscabiei]|nr:hypothetical protein IQ64_28355 [Streptomyces stelliscabiei]
MLCGIAGSRANDVHQATFGVDQPYNLAPLDSLPLAIGSSRLSASESEAVDLIRAAFDLGCTFYDTWRMSWSHGACFRANRACAQKP